MYLKSLEISGFKSFADRTVLQFKPGLMAVVGPNGCGKSNLCEAIRWVLGEKSAKALRGAKMEDVIFGGTDARKPLGMAEVSLTFSDCEGVLQTEFHEVTITRRVFRSGENHYFINKTRCRLKDIQKLFLDTGIGTMSYSMLQQGQIDMILSSRPEDRREIFEEASGINKYKSDKDEALRKLEHTEANLVRLDDVIREVKRQIGSLQRQAGKARRFKELRDELKAVEIFVTQQDAQAWDTRIAALRSRRDRAAAEIEALRATVRELELAHTETQQQVSQAEADIALVIEAGAEARGALERAQDSLRTHAQRITEYETLSERDARDMDRARLAAAEARTNLAALEIETAELRKTRQEADRLLLERSAALAQHEKNMADLRQERQTLHTRLVEAESRASVARNQRMQIESREGASVLRRERLEAEQINLTRLVEQYGAQAIELRQSHEAAREALRIAQARLAELRTQRDALQGHIRSLRHACGELRSGLAARNAQLDMLSGAETVAEDFPGGARLLLDSHNPLGLPKGAVLGALADMIRAPARYERALETVLRAWLDAVVLRDGATAHAAIAQLVATSGGPARLLVADIAGAPLPSTPPGAIPLLAHLEVDARIAALAARILGHVFVVPALATISSTAPADGVFVTEAGELQRGEEAFEYWAPGDRPANPFARRHAAEIARTERDDLQRALEEQQKLLDGKEEEAGALEESIRAAQTLVEQSQLAVGMRDGELRLQEKEAQQTRTRLETVRHECGQIEKECQEQGRRKEELAAKLAIVDEEIASARKRADTVAASIHELESGRSELYTSVTDQKVRSSELRQRQEHAEYQQRTLDARVRELDQQIQGQSRGLASYRDQLEALRTTLAETEQKIPAMQASVQEQAERLASLREQRAKAAEALAQREHELSLKRAKNDELREHLSGLDVERTELSMRRANRMERVTTEYGIAEEDVLTAAEPVWPEGRPGREALDTQLAELRTKLEAMGPVNLVAIEEYQEHEERYAFLTQQREDLVNARLQLLELINRINQTTSELFTQTFASINANFQTIYERMFGGGTAKLVLVNEEDVLECGIEIIARPPGKRLQNVSMLSGGERTMTAVALLFAIYMIKPSPFCVLDELDAALDESNIGRFVDVLQGFLDQSQFLVVTHNQRTITAASVLYGVTMAKNSGISKLVSVRLSAHEEPRPAPAAEPSPPAPEAAPEGEATAQTAASSQS